MCWNFGILAYDDEPIQHAPDFISTVRDAIAKLPYLGVFTVSENNLMCVNWLSWRRGVEPGRYHVWANECRGVFIPEGDPSAAGGLIIFPGV